MAWIWALLKKNFDILLTIVGAIAVAILQLLNRVPPETVSAATLTILSLIAVSLLLNRATSSHFQDTMEKALERLQKPSAEQVLAPYKEYFKEIEERLSLAREVWVLSRTCRRLWEDHNDEFMTLLSNDNGAVRLMLVDPDDGALRMIAASAQMEAPGDAKLLQANVRSFLGKMNQLSAQFRPGSFEIRAIDYLPPWTLILLDPRSDKGKIYVELATFSASPRNRPTFYLKAERDKSLFQAFRTEFEIMWDHARSIDGTQKGLNR